MQHLIEQISESQDGNPLPKYLQGDEVRWCRFTDVEFMSVGDVLNLMLLKVATSDTPADDMEYAQKQLAQAALVVFKGAIAKEAEPVYGNDAHDFGRTP